MQQLRTNGIDAAIAAACGIMAIVLGPSVTPLRAEMSHRVFDSDRDPIVD